MSFLKPMKNVFSAYTPVWFLKELVYSPFFSWIKKKPKEVTSKWETALEKMKRRTGMKKILLVISMLTFFLGGGTKAQEVTIVVDSNPVPPESAWVHFGFANQLDEPIYVWTRPPSDFVIKDSLGQEEVFRPDFFTPEVREIVPGDTEFVAIWDLLDTLGVKVRRGGYQVEMNYYLDQDSYLLSSPFRVDWTDTLMYYDPENPGGYVILPDFEKRAVTFEKSDFGIPSDSTIVIHRLIVYAEFNDAPVELQLVKDNEGLPGETSEYFLSPRMPIVLQEGWNIVSDSTGWTVPDSVFWLVLYGKYSFLLTGYSGYPSDSTHSWINIAGIWGRAQYELGMAVIRSYQDPSGIKDTPTPPLPKGFTLSQNYPNPFNPATTISFELSQSEWVSLDIYNLRGKLVMRLVQGKKESGRHLVLWDGRNEEGLKVPSGIYLYQLKGGEFQQTRKMVLCK